MIESNDNQKKSAIDYLNEMIELSKTFSNAGQEAEFNAIQEIIKKVIDIQNAPEKNCGNCTFWRSRNPERIDAMGICMASKQGGINSQMYSGCGLHTKKDFSCKIHYAKPKNNYEKSPSGT